MIRPEAGLIRLLAKLGIKSAIKVQRITSILRMQAGFKKPLPHRWGDGDDAA